MEVRRRIIIPTDGSIPEPLPAPYFDRDAANSARPVRPLSFSEETQVHVRQPPKRSKVWPLLIAFVIVAAIGAGLAGGYGIAHYGMPTTSEPILAGSTFHTDDAAPAMVFTAPPDEEVAEDTDLSEQDTELADGEDDVDLSEIDPDLFPRPNGRSNNAPQGPPPVRRIPNAPQPPDDESENSRPRRAPDDSDRRTSSKRRDNRSTRDDDAANGPLRRTGRGMLTRIREIFEGKH